MEMSLKEAPLSEHLIPAELQSALRNELSRARWQEVVRHLLGGCAECRSLMAAGLHPRALSAEEEGAYDAVLDASFEHALELRQQQRDEDLPPSVAIAEWVGGPHGQPEAIESLLQQSWALRFDNPHKMVDLARRALEMALSLDPAAFGARRVADQQARTWGELANAHRVADELWEAQEAFGHAFELLERGSGDRLLKVRLLDLHASLLGAQRKFPFALQALDVVCELYQEIGDLHLAGRSLITKAMYMHYCGRSEEALVLNERGLSLIDEWRDPGLPTLAVHNRLWFLVACNRFFEARDILLHDPHCSKADGQVMAVRLRWLKGQIEYGLENFAEAEAIFLEVKEELQNLGLGFAAAVASLDLALAWMHQDRLKEAEEVVLEATGMFAALQIHREVLGAVQLLKEAFRLKKASIELVAETAAFLREWDPPTRVASIAALGSAL
jgi:tetratricopeptide (TPR) repeat protein